MTILITGAAGFIGFHVARSLLNEGKEIIAIDNLNPYYDVKLKQARLDILNKNKSFKFHEIDIADYNNLRQTLEPYSVSRIIHLAAQAGVRHSITHPFDYVESNVKGQLSILEYARNNKNLKLLISASSSSVYGNSKEVPFKVTDNTDNPASLYAATKKSGELMAKSYADLYRIPTVVLRFFTVYGPWGRPDMAYFSFTKNIIEGKPINVFNDGNMRRDFTYIDDIVGGVIGALDIEHGTPYRIYNLGNNKAEKLKDFIEVIESTIGKKAIINYLPMQPGDVFETYADITESIRDLNFRPKTTIQKGIPKFIKWYGEYYGG